MLTKLLIANRGEIACRIIKTAKRLRIPTVAIYSEADQQSLHVKLADEAWSVGDAPAINSYLNIDNIIKICLASGASAIHPGYGFLSESPAFARACAEADIIFVGPSVEAIDAMASKQLAKQLLEQSDVPLTPGYHGDDQSDTRLLTEALQIGFPILLKAALGGGGKGLRAVKTEAQFHEALVGAKREAKAYFSDDTMLIEKLIQNPRHVEIQLMADNHGRVVHLFDRDCSIQRRHQKIIEEAPAPSLSLNLRNALADAAITVARAIHYRGAGTVEFLVDEVNQQFYFMEMNTRLQVEHPVTEMICGLDLVEWQLRIAANEPLPLDQKSITAAGHAIECRLYAEDSAQGFIPSVGQLQIIHEPNFEGIRIDSGVQQNDSVSRFYDPMFAKLIAWGPTRYDAILRMQQALAEYQIEGIKTNLPFLQTIIKHPHFIQAQLSTHFLTDNTIIISKPNIELALYSAASFDYLNHVASDPLFLDTFSWQMHLNSYWYRRYAINSAHYVLTIIPKTPNTFELIQQGESTHLHIFLENDQLQMNIGHRSYHVRINTHENCITVFMEAGSVSVDFCGFGIIFRLIFR
jgi:3-methylcrotonyl-CoA carboxylase alpha subunit